MSDKNGPVSGLYQKYRPRKLKDVVGQDAAVKVLTGLFSGSTFPRALLFQGPSGCGKTTLARIVQKQLGCKDADFYERNCADFRGIDDVREIRRAIGMRPLSGGTCRIWLIDECHRLTADAQEAMLKLLEDAPSHVHFFLATTDPSKLKPTIRTRCTDITVKPVKANVLAALVKSVAESESASIGGDVADRIAEAAEGSPRKALVILEAVLGIDGEDAQLAAVERQDQKAVAIDLARALINPRTTWPDVAKILRDVDEDPESLRRMVMGYCQSILLSEKPSVAIMPRTAFVLKVFTYNLYDSGKPGLTSACWEVVNMGKK